MARIYANGLFQLFRLSDTSTPFQGKKFLIQTAASRAYPQGTLLEALAFDVGASTYDIYYSTQTVGGAWVADSSSADNANSGLLTAMKALGDGAVLVEVLDSSDWDELLELLGQTPL